MHIQLDIGYFLDISISNPYLGWKGKGARAGHLFFVGVLR